MFRRALVLALVLSLGLAARRAAAELPKISSGLASGLRLVEFSIVGGRVAVGSRYSKNYSGTSTNGAARRREQLRIHIDRRTRTPYVEYESHSPKVDIALKARGGGEALFSRSGGDDSRYSKIQLRQHTSEPLVLTLEVGDATREIEAASLWHLWLAEPELCREEVAPLIEMLAPDLALAKRAEAIKAALDDMPVHKRDNEVKLWARWVEQLGGDKFAERRQAELNLRAAGQPAALYLEALDLDRLDPEQRLRVRRVLAARRSPAESETPRRVARRLAADPRVWLALMARPALDQRRRAAEHLAQLLPAPFDFDPEADAAARAEQIEALRAKLEGR